jgi:hypothetical protein
MGRTTVNDGRTTDRTTVNDGRTTEPVRRVLPRRPGGSAAEGGVPAERRRQRGGLEACRRTCARACGSCPRTRGLMRTRACICARASVSQTVCAPMRHGDAPYHGLHHGMRGVAARTGPASARTRTRRGEGAAGAMAHAGLYCGTCGDAARVVWTRTRLEEAPVRLRAHQAARWPQWHALASVARAGISGTRWPQWHALASVARSGLSGTHWHQWHALASVARAGLSGRRRERIAGLWGAPVSADTRTGPGGCPPCILSGSSPDDS